MKYVYSVLFFVLTLSLNAQHTISGTFSPAKPIKWVVAYRIVPGSQVYIADSKVDNGTFTLNIKADATPGMYRLTYGAPQEDYYFDIVYSGKEDIDLNYDLEQGLSFNSSQENIIFSNYFNEISKCEQEIANFYSTKKGKKSEFLELIASLKEIQENYESKSKNLYCHTFITANTPYIPKKYEDAATYITNKKEQYFTALDFGNSTLQSSDFLIEKAANYILTALPLKQLNPAELDAEMQTNIDTLTKHLKNKNPKFSTHLLNMIWGYLTDNNLNNTADYLYATYLKPIASALGYTKITTKIETYNRVRIGAKAPEITWTDNGKTKKLSELPKAEQYVVVFWSSTCSHCLKEVPQLHKELKKYSNVKVLAVGLEDDDVNWKKESAKLPAFTHALALEKWDNKYVSIYDIHQTPTYFILNSNKEIIAKPENDMEVISFLKGEN